MFFVFFWNLNKALSVDLIYLGAVFVYAVVFVIFLVVVQQNVLNEYYKSFQNTCSVTTPG